MPDELTATQIDFRAAMANLSAAVNIITTDGVGGRAGITVSAVCSVTDQPPTLLICVNQSSYTHDIFRTNRRVAVNVLGAGQEDIAMHFAGRTSVPMAERFDGPEWNHQTHGVPVLTGATASLVGEIGAEVTQGSHTVLFVHIDHVASQARSGGLVYFQRQFHPIIAEPQTV
ncbi:MAG: flavin reductase [Aeromicrobium sp.]